MAGYLQENSTSVNSTSLAQVRAIISGDLGFASPLAVQPIGFALGGEYRSYKAQQQSDLLAKTAGELGGAGGAAPGIDEIGRAHVCTQVTNAHLVCRLLLDKKKKYSIRM